MGLNHQSKGRYCTHTNIRPRPLLLRFATLAQSVECRTLEVEVRRLKPILGTWWLGRISPYQPYAKGYQVLDNQTLELTTNRILEDSSAKTSMSSQLHSDTVIGKGYNKRSNHQGKKKGFCTVSPKDWTYLEAEIMRADKLSASRLGAEFSTDAWNDPHHYVRPTPAWSLSDEC